MAKPPEAVVTVPDDSGPSGQFRVHLENFSGPFDLLLSLIAKHKLDITEIALAEVTDDFIAFIKHADLTQASDTPSERAQASWDLGTASEFLVVAATLLDLKAARLLPAGTVEDAEDLELLEARDLLFARLLQYRAFKQVAATIGSRLADEALSLPRQVALEPDLVALLPELVWSLTSIEFAEIAARALGPKPLPPTVDLEHLHDPKVSVREQAAVVVQQLRAATTLSFRTLTADTDGIPVVVARFLALLELFRDGVIAFDQAAALGELTIRWTGGDITDVAAVVESVGDEFDEAPQTVDVDADKEQL